ncbi:hypothetical protein Pcinc_040187 [Petrolisthes cinctipes]|uniref:Uncharacterized protein n=1 Tax=Petrolisthes cinctipes TaxID=88211 RepID=A0AAE1BME6_PETCI|nr:hypothetical protein Pcinc_040187 [Petrolisthes cinctipes]
MVEGCVGGGPGVRQCGGLVAYLSGGRGRILGNLLPRPDSSDPSRGIGGKVPVKRPGKSTGPLRVGGRSFKNPETSATSLSRVRLKDKPPCIADGN